MRSSTFFFRWYVLISENTLTEVVKKTDNFFPPAGNRIPVCWHQRTVRLLLSHAHYVNNACANFNAYPADNRSQLDR